MSAKTKIALFGGSFNPPHIGHLVICEWLLQNEQIDQVWIVPCFEHPFGKELAPFPDRYQMCQIAFAKFGEKLMVSTIEQELGGTSHTIRTIRHLQQKFPDYTFSLVTGGDIHQETKDWHEFEEIKKLVPIISIPRGKGSMIPDVSSTEIRGKIAKNEPVDELVAQEVKNYLEAHKLYS
ncbi:MAG: nicotinate (nicotinamide) nucleotide adenylyltransferase [Pseudomonadota bacterium]